MTKELREDSIFTILETEFPTVLSEDVEELARKVKEGTELDVAIRSLLATGEYCAPSDEIALRDAYARLAQIEKLTDEALQSLARAVELKSVKQKAEAPEDQRLLDDPVMQADVDHFIKLAYWDNHEATCLLLEKDPRYLSKKTGAGGPVASEGVGHSYRRLKSGWSNAPQQRRQSVRDNVPRLGLGGLLFPLRTANLHHRCR